MSENPRPSEIDWFDYFMVRLSRVSNEPDRLSGLVERIGSGERRSFDTVEQLVDLVAQWSTPGPPA